MLIFLIAGLVVATAGIVFLVSTCKKFKGNADIKVIDKNTFIKLLIGYLPIGLGFVLLQFALVTGNEWVLTAGEYVCLILGTYLFVSSVTASLVCLYFYYWKIDIDPKQKKIIRIVMFAGIAAALIFLIVMSEGVANHLTYPLVNKIHLFANGAILATSSYNSGTPSGGLTITFYAVCILTGVLVVYWICDHEFYKKFGKHGIVDSLALVAFPAGVIGSRIGYVIGNWNGDSTSSLNGWQYWITEGHWYKIWEGGLTILGGAIGGIIVGVIFMMVRRKYISVRWAMDVIVPAVLVAQAIGRWGNFFNHEVYGFEVEASSWWFLPTIIRNQMATSFVSGAASGTTIYVPLFLVESIVNISGFFIIKYGMGRLVPKILPEGSLCGGYLIWYGITRIIMEPLRDAEFNMGTDGNWSNIWAIIYVAMGLAVIGLFFLIDYLSKKKVKAK